MHRQNHVNSNTVLVKLKLIFRILVKRAGSRFSTPGVVKIPVKLLVRIPRRPDIDRRRRIVQATLAGELPKSWLN